jgi:hypothetical protein
MQVLREQAAPIADALVRRTRSASRALRRFPAVAISSPVSARIDRESLTR